MLLKIGSKGEDVKKLQTKLGLLADGNFGPKTEAAVKSWQSTNGLVSDGIVGDATWTKMFGEEQPLVIPTSQFKLEKLKGHIPDSVILQIPECAQKFNITNVLRLTHFLAQCSHESGGFSAVSENLNYSADGLMKIFGHYFTPELAKSYAFKPEMIASRVYGNRMGNGNEASKEGFKFRGRGYVQLTGKENYARFSKFIGEDCVLNPDLVANKYPLASAGYFFDSNKLWSICDQGATDAVVTQVTRRVNGGTNGLAHRLSEFKKFWSLLS
jgi:putative chitinase